MTIPSVLYGILFSTMYGAIFHLWKGGKFSRLLLYILLSWAGFWIGHILASLLGWTFLSIGPLHLGLATLFSALFLFVGHWLSLIKPLPTEK
jgi:hypothetical protein